MTSSQKKKMSAAEGTSALIKAVLKMPAAKIISLLNELEEKKHKNKREPRINYRAEVAFSVGEKFCSGYIANINSSGIFIETEDKFKPGEKLTLSFALPIDNIEHVKVKGEIVRVSQEGIGVNFDLNIEELLNMSYEKKAALCF